MTREELIDKICPECNRYDCNDRCCEDCDEQLNKWLDEYDKQIRAEVIEEFLKKDKECQQSSEECPYMNSDIACIECIAEQLKEQK